jgi:menaquinone-specific isochorismate synthase
VGWGRVATLSARGKDRIADLAEQWREFASGVEIVDPLREPGTGLVAFGTIAFDDESQAESVLVVPKVILGSRDGQSWMTVIDDASLPDAADVKPSAPANFSAGKTSRSDFKSAVQTAVEKIRSGEIEKVVLARDLVANLPADFDLRAPLIELAKNYPSCWIYSVDGMFGASPELLVRVSHGQVSARVLAGTAGRGTDPGVDHAIGDALAASHKNVSEHAFAVDSMVRALAPFCKQVDADPKPFPLKLPNVWHLASDVHGVLNESASVLDLAAAIHPTAAVAGTPREKALSAIRELEPGDRGRYAGPVGWIGADGDGEWAIALRGAQIEDGRLRAFAGCGIVAESEPDAEAAETDLKFQPIIEALSS